jgi:hypothetical protein
MDANSYWDGRQGKSYSGGNMNDYEIGKRDGTTYSNDGGYGCLPFLVLLILLPYIHFVIPAVIASLLSATISYIIVNIYIQKKYSSSQNLKNKKNYPAFLLTSFIYQIILIQLIQSLIPVNNSLSRILPFIGGSEIEAVNIPLQSLLLFQLPCLLISGIVMFLNLRIYPEFKGIIGYLRVTFIITLLMTILILFSLYLWVTVTGLSPIKYPFNITI